MWFYIFILNFDFIQSATKLVSLFLDLHCSSYGFLRFSTQFLIENLNGKGKTTLCSGPWVFIYVKCFIRILGPLLH